MSTQERLRSIADFMDMQNGDYSLSDDVALLRALSADPSQAMIEAAKLADPLSCDVPEDEAASIYSAIWRAMLDAAK